MYWTINGYIPQPPCPECLFDLDLPFWSFIPHLGHLPGSIEVTSGCMGQEYAAVDLSSNVIPHLGHLPGTVLIISGCMEHEY